MELAPLAARLSAIERCVASSSPSRSHWSSTASGPSASTSVEGPSDVHVAKWQSDNDNSYVRELAGSSILAQWSDDQKRQFIHALLSPFTATASTIEELLSI